MNTLADELEALAEKATAGPWSKDIGYSDCVVSNGNGGVLIYDEGGHTEHDAALIVALENNLDKIIAALRAREPSEENVERVASEIERQFRGGRNPPDSSVFVTCARAALRAMENNDAG